MFVRFVVLTIVAGAVASGCYSGSASEFATDYILFEQLMNYSLYIDVSNVSVVYKLYTPDNPTVAQDFKLHDLDKRKFQMDTEKRYKFLCHGWQYNVTSSWYAGTVAKYMKTGNFNVITVEYPNAKTLCASYAVLKFQKVAGLSIARMVLKMHKKYDVPIKNVHLIGHSTGAQITMAAGRAFALMTGFKLERITGLDPVYTSFGYGRTPFMTHSAKFVDIIHTSYMCHLFPQGTVDFFINGGFNQTGCEKSIHCEHMLSVKLFEMSINSNEFVATRCTSYNEFKFGRCDDNKKIIMGENVDTENSKGAYFIDLDESLYSDLPKDVEVADFNRDDYVNSPYHTYE